MKIEGVPFGVTDWSTVPETTHPGVSGVATWRTVQAGNVRVRVVTYSPGYLADHWCTRDLAPFSRPVYEGGISRQ